MTCIMSPVTEQSGFQLQKDVNKMTCKQYVT